MASARRLEWPSRGRGRRRGLGERSRARLRGGPVGLRRLGRLARLGLPTVTPCSDGDALLEGLGGLALLRRRGCRAAAVPATMRKRSCAVRLTASTRLEAFLPGISTMMLRLPWVETSASETPLPLTRASTMPAACLSLVGVIAPPCSIGRERDPGAALEVEPQAGLPGAAERGQSVEDERWSARRSSRVRPGRGVFFATVLVSPQSSVRAGTVRARSGARPGRLLEVLHPAYDDLACHCEDGARSDLDLGPRLGQRANGPEDPRGEDHLAGRPRARAGAAGPSAAGCGRGA